MATPADAGDVVLEIVGSRVRALGDTIGPVRRDEHDAVHQFRVGARRLRTVLATYRPVLRRDVTDPLRDELRWVAGVAGAARDAEVAEEQLGELLATVPGWLVLGPVDQRVHAVLRQRYRRAHDDLLAVLDGDRFAELLAGLERLLVDPPLTARATEDAAPVLARCVRRDDKRLRAAVAAAARASTEQEHAELLHEVRKAAKRLRYAAESVEAVHGKDAARVAGRAKTVQTHLGDHQDTVVQREVLLELADLAHRAGEPGFTYGLLHAEAARRGREASGRAEVALAELAGDAGSSWPR
ncbi:CHAD domain-containing protein [Actinomycetospora succinea]|uniref:CHAD domain-containing protein n=1 Tax=Actinomycetospora succinea TaxID=663603 RepID=A0A4R6VQL4_9PSEU|nr:CHAD domain-containing protein [Actinomycetospora succinea]TDQ64816.1 CHAD domain-containing protein [Actinomycetospora succinea]